MKNFIIKILAKILVKLIRKEVGRTTCYHHIIIWFDMEGVKNRSNHINYWNHNTNNQYRIEF